MPLMSDWEADVRWARMQRQDRMNPYRAMRFYRNALIVSGLLNLAMFLMLSALSGKCGG
jgi:hypothetical protein